MRIVVFIMALSIFFADASATSAWKPDEKYGEDYPCDNTAKARGYSSGNYYLYISNHLWNGNDETNKYSVAINVTTCPSGHTCDIQGVGTIHNGKLEVTPNNTDEGDDEYLKDCHITISKNKNGSLKVKELKSGACENYFLCGAATSITKSEVKPNNTIPNP